MSTIIVSYVLKIVKCIYIIILMISVIGHYFTVETGTRHMASNTSGNIGSCEYLIRTMGRNWILLLSNVFGIKGCHIRFNSYLTSPLGLFQIIISTPLLPVISTVNNDRIISDITRSKKLKKSCNITQIS